MVEHYFLDRSEKENDITLLAKKDNLISIAITVEKDFFW